MFTLLLFSLLHHLLVCGNLTIILKEKSKKGFVILNICIYY